MTIDDIKKCVEKIRADHDDEAQHIDEDRLRHNVLDHIAEHCTDPICKAMAVEALKTSELDFARWCV